LMTDNFEAKYLEWNPKATTFKGSLLWHCANSCLICGSISVSTQCDRRCPWSRSGKRLCFSRAPGCGHLAWIAYLSSLTLRVERLFKTHRTASASRECTGPPLRLALKTFSGNYAVNDEAQSIRALRNWELHPGGPNCICCQASTTCRPLTCFTC
jgi:hypothetical protein